MDEHFRNIVSAYRNGYFVYSFVINFKPNSDYNELHPKKAHKKFVEHFQRYFKRHPEFTYIIFPELSSGGKYHVHGLIFHHESDFDKHDKKFRLVRNYWTRMYGWNGVQRIYSLTGPYQTSDLRFQKQNMWTDFQRVWAYIIKDYKKFPFLNIVADLHRPVPVEGELKKLN